MDVPFSQQLRRERKRRGWSQLDVAERIGIDTKTVQRWERGKTLPQPYYQQALCTLFEKSVEEFGLLTGRDFVEQVVPPSIDAGAQKAPPVQQEEWRTDTKDPAMFLETFLEDWGESPSLERFYGRERELEITRGWICEESCRLVALVGMGGIGKTAFTAHLIGQIKGNFSLLFWRSLHNVPPFQQFMRQALPFFSRQQIELPSSSEDQITLLIQQMREHRCLLVLDNLESILQAGQTAGTYREGYEAYGRLLQRVGESNHSSCLIVTSREKTNEIAHLEGITLPVRSLSLSGVGQSEARALLEHERLSGRPEEWAAFIHMYAGNPLALKLVAQTIRTLFNRSLASFLEQQEGIFGDIDDLLEQQFLRLSQHEQELLYWLAIEREAITIHALRDNLVQPPPKRTSFKALDSLHKRSLIENRDGTRFQLQPVIMEYLVGRLVEQAYQDFVGNTLAIWEEYAFVKAQAKEYVRNAQLHFILKALAELLLHTVGKAGLAVLAKEALGRHRQRLFQRRDYLAANLLHLLLHLGHDVRGSDFSCVPMRQAYLQDVTLSHVDFSHTHFVEPAFTSTFESILAVAFHPDGTLLGLGTTKGDVWLYDTASSTPLVTCSGHTDGVWSLAFHPSENRFASSGDDQTIRCWEIETGHCLFVLREHTSRVRTLAFSPDGQTLASGSDDATIRLWESNTGQCTHILRGHAGRVWAVAYNADGSLLASGSTDGTIRLWDAQTGQCLNELTGHIHGIRSLAFHRNGVILASGSDDQTIRLWDTQTSTCISILRGHTNRIWSVAFSRISDLLASGSEDQRIRLWDVDKGESLSVFPAHAHGVRSVSFHPTEPLLASGGEDQAARLWDVDRSGGNCLKTFHGYTSRIRSLAVHPREPLLVSSSEDRAVRLWDATTGQCLYTSYDHLHGVKCVAFHPDGQIFATGGEDQTIRLRQTETGRHLSLLQGHENWVWAIAFSPDGQQLASGSEDHTVRLWDIQTGQCLHVLGEHGDWVRALVFSPELLASGGDDKRIFIWERRTGHCLHILEGHTNRVRSLAFHPEGRLLASSSEDCTVRLWKSETGQSLHTLTGHTGWVRSVAFSQDGTVLASGGEDQTICLWDVEEGNCLARLKGHTARIRTVAFHPSENVIISSSDDGTIRLWNGSTHKETMALRCERPYEGMNIAYASGLTEVQRSMLLALGAIEVPTG